MFHSNDYHAQLLGALRGPRERLHDLPNAIISAMLFSGDTHTNSEGSHSAYLLTAVSFCLTFLKVSACFLE